MKQSIKEFICSVNLNNHKQINSVIDYVKKKNTWKNQPRHQKGSTPFSTPTSSPTQPTTTYNVILLRTGGGSTL